MKKILFFCTLGSIVLVNAQTGRVGINTETPKSTMDIYPISGETARGVMIPRVTVAELKTMTTSLSADQNSMLVFVTDTMPVADRTDQYIDVTEPGYYFYNKSLDINNHTTKAKWERFNNALERIAQNSKVGYRLVGSTKNLGNIGTNAIDLSFGGNVKNVGATGDYSFAQGLNATSSGSFSFSQGSTVVASGNFSVAMGENNQASGYGATAVGGGRNTASADYSFATGKSNTSSGIASFSGGDYNKATGDYSFVYGYGNAASAAKAIAMGEINKAEGNFSLAIGGNNNTVTGVNSAALAGANNKATADYSLVVGGGNNIASGEYSIVLGGGWNQASGYHSAAMGTGSKATKSYSLAFGENNTASEYGAAALGGARNNATGKYSFATNAFNTASGMYSTALGYGTIASGEASLSIGKFNAGVGDNVAFVVGNGKSKATSDAFTVLFDGKTGVGVNNFQNTTSTTRLQVNGGVQVSNDTNSCSSANAGTIRFVSTSKKFQGCTGDAWVDLN